jgi:hypothetical protein
MKYNAFTRKADLDFKDSKTSTVHFLKQNLYILF